MKQPPFTTRSGVRIGLMYEAPKRYEASGDMERLQSALIGQGRSFRSVLNDWTLYLVLVAILIAAITLTSCAGNLK